MGKMSRVGNKGSQVKGHGSRVIVCLITLIAKKYFSHHRNPIVMSIINC